jgi:signal transduction histidine kinase
MEVSTLADLATGTILVGAGALATARPRGRATGFLLAATGAAWLLGSAFEALVFLHRGPLAHLLLAYPRARVAGRGRLSVVAAAYVTGAVEPLGASHVLTAALCGAVVGMAGERWARSGGIERRTAASALVAAVAVCGTLGAGTLARAAGASDSIVLAVYETTVALAAVGLAADVLVGRWARGVITSLLLDLGRLQRAGPLADEIGRAVGDPSLAIVYRSGDGYVDEARRPVELPADDEAHRQATLIVDDGAPVAALVHDTATLADPALERAAVAAARTALENARLHGEVAARVEELEASARRLVTAGDAERRRLARAVEEQAERRLAGVASLLADVEPALAQETTDARAELGRFAAGLRPRRLSVEGLSGALDDLARRAGIPVEVRAPRRRFAGVVEATIFFVCSEALANVTKHAGAKTVRLEVAERDGRLVAEIDDDGAGGADAASGSGLRGLADRVEALGGTLAVVSTHAAGTTVRAEVPARAP